MRAYSGRENISENLDIQHIINSWSLNRENDDDYIETRKGRKYLWLTHQIKEITLQLIRSSR